MWFRLGIQNFIVKKVINDHYELYISDFKRIWHTSLSNDELVSISQRLNPLFEASVQKLKEITWNLFHDDKADKEISQENNSITVKLKSNSLGVNFMFEIVLHKQNEDIFYKEFTLPLLLVFIEMQNREKKLIKIITDKDEEIKEYKQECGSIKSDYASTETFCKEAFESEDSIRNICDINSFIECINLNITPVKKEVKPCDKLNDMCLSGAGQNSVIDTKGNIFKDKNVRINGPKQYVKLEHETVKRRKKQSDPFKIKL